MSAPIMTAFGEAVPPATRHSVTVHMGGWDTVEKYGADSSTVIPHFKNAYPRMKPHRDIVQLADAILKHIGASPKESCLLFASLQSAHECVGYSVSASRDQGKGRKPVPVSRISVVSLAAKDPFYAVIFPLEYKPVVAGFWSTPGVGMSSRFAEANLGHLDQLRVPASTIGRMEREQEEKKPSFDGSDHQVLRERIVSYLERAPLDPQEQMPAADDVYLYPTGMAAIYKPHRYLLNKAPGSTVLFGMAFMNTLTAFHEYGRGFKHFGHGSDADLLALESFLGEERAHGRRVQAIWVEFPANPLLVTPNVARLRELADEYDVVLGIDDTISSWVNVDVTAHADILVTSLTKSFNGYADVIAGSAVLNPASPRYTRVKPLFERLYVPELYVDDAAAIERNSRDYLSRTIRLNANAEALVAYLDSCARDPASAVRAVHYPSLNASGVHYRRFMRPATSEFTPGFGCLFSVELDDLDTTRAFYDALNVHKSVHLGAPFTLAFAYTMCTYKKNLPWAAQYGMRPTQIRISAGLEDTEILLEDFKAAVEAADRVKAGRG